MNPRSALSTTLPGTTCTSAAARTQIPVAKTCAQFKVDTVEEAVRRNREDIEKDPAMVAKIKRELKGKRLGCWCKTKKNPNAPCHGDTLLEIANS